VSLPNLQFWKHYPRFRHESRQLIESASKGLRFHPPELLKSGEGGAYLLRAEDGSLLAVYKPFDEDPFSLRNPKAPPKNSTIPLSSSAPTRTSINPPLRPGESAHKEVAAYLLDHNNLAGVPFTTLVRLFGAERWGSEGKIGSLQLYVGHEHDSWELSPSLYSKTDVHSIALLDLRLLNMDRHGGNILVRRNNFNYGANNRSASPVTVTTKNVNNCQLENNLSEGNQNPLKLVPIDHGFCLPDSVEGDDLWFEWMSWPQARLSVDARLQRYVKEIDVEEDSAVLRGLGLGEEAVRTMMICSVLLQQAVLKGLSPLQIAEILCKRSVTNFINENGEMLQVMRYRIEEMLVHVGASSALFGAIPCRNGPTLFLDPRGKSCFRKKHRRQNSAPQLAGPFLKGSCLGAC